MERMACIDIAAFPLQLLLWDHPNWRGYPAGVVDQDKAQGTILWVNSRARATGILPGMRYGVGLTLSHHFRADVISRTVIEKAVADLVPRLQHFTAEVEPSRDEPGVFWLDTSGLSLLHSSLEKWGELIHDDLTEAGFRNTIAIGFSRFGSYAAAKACDRIVVFPTPREERTYIRKVPLEQLNLASTIRDLLAQIGIHTLGGFLDLPTSQVRSRLGREAHRLHQLATGNLWSPLHPEMPPDPTTTGTFLDYPEADRGRLMVLMEELLEPLLDSLEQRHEMMTMLLLRLRLDDKSENTEILRSAKPTLDKIQVLDLLRLRMETVALTAGVTEIVMEIQGVSPDFWQGELFQTPPVRDYDAANRALAQLRARFGNGALLRACLRTGYLPEARFAWEPMETMPSSKPRRVWLRPLVRRFFPKPLRLRNSGSPVGATEVVVSDPRLDNTQNDGSFFGRESTGPYIISGGWWGSSSGVHREYHFVRTDEGSWLWIYYDSKRHGWFLHGKVE